jgi:hypothetical protein
MRIKQLFVSFALYFLTLFDVDGRSPGTKRTYDLKSLVASSLFTVEQAT